MNDNRIIPRCPKCGSETDKLGFCKECGWMPMSISRDITGGGLKIVKEKETHEHTKP